MSESKGAVVVILKPASHFANEDAMEMKGEPFKSRRGNVYVSTAPLPGPPRTFMEGLKICMRLSGGATVAEVADDYGYTSTWVTDIIRRLEGKTGRGQMGITRETVIMLRQSIPALHMQMSLGTVMWPKLAAFDDYSVRRPGYQTQERLREQAERRKSKKR